MESVIAERKERGEFKSLFEFTERVDLRAVQRSTVEALIKCGAFASLGAKRAQLLQALDRAVEMGQQSQLDKRMGQLNMFAAANGSSPSPNRLLADALPEVDELPDAELLKFEKELLGFYITSHPLTEHQSALENFSTATTREAMNCSEGTEVTIGGMINRVKKSVTKNGRSAGMTMAMITLEDLDGQIDGVLFAETLADVNKRYPDCISAERILFLKGKIDRRRETPSIVVTDVIPVAEAVARLTTSVGVKLDPARHVPATAAELDALLRAHKGNTEVYVQVVLGSGQKIIMKLDRERFVKPTEELRAQLMHLLSAESVQFTGAGTRRRKRQQQQALFKEAEPDADQPAASPPASAADSTMMDEPAAAVDD